MSVLQNLFKFGNCYPKFRRVVLDKLGIQIGLIADSGILAAKISDHMAILRHLISISIKHILLLIKLA